MHARSSLQGVDGAVMRIVKYSECMVSIVSAWWSTVSAWWSIVSAWWSIVSAW
jgi:hypothetical protein